MNAPYLVEVDIGVTPEAAVSGAILLQTEESAFLMFNAMRNTDRPCPHGGFYKEDAGTAVVELVACTITKFGYPNDEVWNSIPLTKEQFYGVFEVQNSPWKEEIIRLHQFRFPETKIWRGSHFVFLFHDSSFECIASELKIEVSVDSYRQVFDKFAARAIG